MSPFERTLVYREVLVDTFQSAGSYALPLSGDESALKQYYWKVAGDTLTTVLHLREDLPIGLPPRSDDDSVRVRMVMSVLSGLESAEHKPIEERIDTTELDSIVALSLEEAGIELDHAYGVLTYGDSLSIGQPHGYRDQLKASSFRSRLFPHDLFSEPADLVVYFPERA